MPAHNQGEVLLAWLVFSDGQGAKRRPVLVMHDFGDDYERITPTLDFDRIRFNAIDRGGTDLG